MTSSSSRLYVINDIYQLSNDDVAVDDDDEDEDEVINDTTSRTEITTSSTSVLLTCQQDGIETTTDVSSHTINNALVGFGGGGRYFSGPDITTKCFHCGGIGHKRADCANEKKNNPCFLCGSMFHLAGKCSSYTLHGVNGTICWICDESSHSYSTCKKSSLQSRMIWCCNCAQCGHDQSVCRAARITSLITREQAMAFNIYQTSRACFSCGQNGHQASMCPNKQNTNSYSSLSRSHSRIKHSRHRRDNRDTQYSPKYHSRYPRSTRNSSCHRKISSSSAHDNRTSYRDKKRFVSSKTSSSNSHYSTKHSPSSNSTVSSSVKRSSNKSKRGLLRHSKTKVRGSKRSKH